MSHVDEGALHAYLDGALEEYPTREAHRIRAHLERCDRCAEALREARALRDTANAILAAPDLSVAPPPLEELKRRAHSSEANASEGRSRLHRFGWAASVVLALGVGWMWGTQAMSSDGDRAEVAAGTERPTAPEPPTSATDAATSGAAEDEPVVPERPAPLEVPSLDLTPVLAEADVTELVRDEEAVGALQAPPEFSYDAADTRVAADAEALVEERGPADEEPAEEAEARATEPGLALATRSDGPRNVVPPRSLESSRDRPEGSREGDEPSDPGSLVVPGLEVLSIVWREEGVVPAGVRVLQQLEDGDTLELIHLPDGFDPSGVAPPEPDQEELVVPRGQGWLILRGPLEEHALEEMLRRLDEAPPAF